MKIKRFALSILSILIALPACSNVTGESNEEKELSGPSYLESIIQEGESEIHEGDFESIDLGETHELKIDNPDYNRWTYTDVDPDYTLYLQYDKDRMSLADASKYVSITSNADDEKTEFTIKQPVSGSGYEGFSDVLAVSPKTEYEAGKGYTVTIAENAPLHFYNRNETIKKVLFTVKDEEHENVEFILDFPTYPFSNIISDTGFGVIKPCLVYDGQINENTNDIVRFTDDPNDKFIDTLVCKIVSKSYQEGKTTLFYIAPEVSEVIKECDAHYVDHGLDFENNYHAPELEELRTELINSEPILTSFMAVANEYGFSDEDSFFDFLKSLKLDVTFSGSGNTFNCLISLTGIHKFTSGKLEGWVLRVCIMAEYHKTFNVSCDAKVKKWLGIPYGVDVSFGASTDDSTTFGLRLNLVNKKYDKNVDVDKPIEADDFEEAAQMVKNLKEKWQDHEIKKTVDASDDGSTLSIKLGWICFYLGWITVEIDIYICITVEISGNFVFGWTRSTHSEIVSYSSSKGGKSDAGNSTSEVGTHMINAVLFVKLNFEVFLRVEVYVYITGMKWMLNIALTLDVGVYFTVIGLGEIDWDITGEKVSGSFGFLFEFGLFFRVKLTLHVLEFTAFNLSLYNKRFPFFKLDTLEDIKSHVDLPIELTSNETGIGTTTLLTFNVFDGYYFTMKTHTYGLYEEKVFIDSIFFDDVSFRVIRGISSSNPKVKIDGEVIKVDKDVAETEGYFTVSYIDSIVGSVKTCSIPFHFLSENAHYLSFDGENKVAMLPGRVISFPEPEERPGYIFDGWYLNGQRVDMTKTYSMPDHDVNYVSKYKLIKYCTVNYYDAKMNLVYTEKVIEGRAAKGPEASVRDQYMGSNYIFVGWDKDLSCITENTSVYGIYVKVGQDNE